MPSSHSTLLHASGPCESGRVLHLECHIVNHLPSLFTHSIVWRLTVIFWASGLHLTTAPSDLGLSAAQPEKCRCDSFGRSHSLSKREGAQSASCSSSPSSSRVWPCSATAACQSASCVVSPHASRLAISSLGSSSSLQTTNELF